MIFQMSEVRSAGSWGLFQGALDRIGQVIAGAKLRMDATHDLAEGRAFAKSVLVERIQKAVRRVL